jgi:antitoxin component of MazEF toxin-antitoxin module
MPINVKKLRKSAAGVVREAGDRIVIQRIGDPDSDLAAMVAKITSENRHEETDFGPPSGAEVW